MRKTLNKITSVLMITSLMLSTASCVQGGPKKNVKVIAADSPWYNGEIINVDVETDPARTVYFQNYRMAGADEKYVYVYVEGNYYVSDWSKVQKSSDFEFKEVLLIDRSTKETCKAIDLFSVLGVHEEPEYVLYSDGCLIAKCESWDPETGNYSKRDYYIDPETAEILDSRDTGVNDSLGNDIYYSMYSVGDYTVEVWFHYYCDPVTYCFLKICSPDGSEKEVEFKSPDENYYEAPAIFALDDTTALVPIPLSKGYKYYELDLTTCEYTECDAKDYDWLDLDKIQHCYSSPEGYVYYTTPNGVSKIDLKNKTDEQVFDFSWSDVNRQYLSYLEIAYCTDDYFLLCGEYNTPNMFTSQFVMNCAVIEFTKADTNPHAGKQILELYVADGEVDATLSDAIIKYNDTSNDCYIEISDRYTRGDYVDFSDINSQDDYDSAWLNADAALSDELAIDIINGEGPDIIMNTSALGQLNNDNCLVDLSPYLTDLDDTKYFTNIFEGAKTDGKLYQLPISITIEGIQTDPAYAGASGVGFTTEEYEQFLSDALNGSDAIESGQALYFAKLFGAMQGSFVKDGKIDLTGPEYAELAEYVKDHVWEKSVSWDLDYSEMSPEEYAMGKNWKTAYYCNCPTITGYLVKRTQIKNGTAILGIPSTDGRGPMFGANISVAVSSHSANIDACVDFVKLLLADDVQSALAYNDKIVLNRDALREVCGEAIEYYDTVTGSQSVFDYAQGTDVTILPILTTDDIDNLEGVIESCSGMNSSDAAINKILIEEMPAYFLDQKDLDAVIEIIQDRAQKVLDERG